MTWVVNYILYNGVRVVAIVTVNFLSMINPVPLRCLPSTVFNTPYSRSSFRLSKSLISDMLSVRTLLALSACAYSARATTTITVKYDALTMFSFWWRRV